MSGIRVPATIAGAIFGVMIVAIVAGDVAIDSGVVKNPDAFATPAKIVFFALFVAFGFSLIPLMVRLVLGFQVLVGNANLAPVKAAVARSNWIVGSIWALMALGLVTALPAAIRQGFFGSNSPSAESSAATAIAAMPVQGILVAAPGMPVRRMLEESTLRLRAGSESPLFSGARFGGAAIFDYRVAGTATTFRRCRYYYITTDPRRPDRVEEISVGVSAEKLSRAGLESAQRLDRARLRADGWHSGDGRAWRRGGVVLRLRDRRLDDPAAGEDPARAGEWIEYVELHEVKV